MKYLKQFVIGSSWLVVIHFLYMAAYHRPNKNWLYKNYSLVVSFSFGIYNVLSLIIKVPTIVRIYPLAFL